MSLASQLGTLVGTGTAYLVHYTEKGTTPLSVGLLIYSNRQEIQKFAVKHALDKTKPDAIQDNLLECLEYIDW